MSRTRSLGGGIWLQKTPLLDGEIAILEDWAYYLLPGWMRLYGQLSLSNKRLVFCPGRVAFTFPFRRKPFGIELSEITEARRSQGIKTLLGSGLEVHTADRTYAFAFSLFGIGKGRRWADAILSTKENVTA